VHKTANLSGFVVVVNDQVTSRLATVCAGAATLRRVLAFRTARSSSNS